MGIICIPLYLKNGIYNDAHTTEHTITLKHPGKGDFEVVKLIETRDKNGYSTLYYLDVKSVICLEKVCKVIPVRIYWDNIGKYLQYELKKGDTLEKYDADLFDPQDYKKLHAILLNEQSPFKDYHIDEILVIPQNKIDVDTFSGATIINFNKKDNIEGAVLTCYTLWHWAHGEIINHIREITSKSLSHEKIIEFIKTDNEVYLDIVLGRLKKDNKIPKNIFDVIIEKALENSSYTTKVLHFLKIANKELYLNGAKRLYLEGNKKHRLTVLRSLKYVYFKLPKDYFDDLYHKINLQTGYQEISLVLEIINCHGKPNKTIINIVLPLLANDFIIARRIYWFLVNQKLDKVQQLKVQLFYKKNSDKL